MLCIIAAVDSENGIGREGSIPWSKTEHGRDDMKYFRAKTMNCAVIMGRKTYASIGGPLPGRCNIVVSRDPEYREKLGVLVNSGCANTHAADSLDSAIAIARNQIAESQSRGISMVTLTNTIYVIGGASLYAEAMGHGELSRAYITAIPGSYNCDVFMPQIHMQLLQSEGPLRVYGNRDEDEYLRLIAKGVGAPLRQNRTGVPTHGLFAEKLEFSLTRGSELVLPLLTTKRVPWKIVLAELLWFLSGECTRVEELHRGGCHIWDGNTTREFLDSRGLGHYDPGECGPIYGYQWRHWNRPYVFEALQEMDSEPRAAKVHPRTCGGIDQIAAVIKTLRNDPFDRRMIVSAWNPEQLSAMALPPCHWSFQFHCDYNVQDTVHNNNVPAPKYTLNCLVNMRSADLALGVPFNIASYALLTHMIAHCVGMRPGRLVIMMADCHVYSNHVEPAATQLARVPRQFPTLKFHGVDPGGDIDQFVRGGIDTVEVCGYSPHPTIKYPMAV